MPIDRNDSHAARSPRKMGWIIGGVLVLLLVILALNGVFRGIGEATGVTEAAPAYDNASPAAETVGLVGTGWCAFVGAVIRCCYCRHPSVRRDSPSAAGPFRI